MTTLEFLSSGHRLREQIRSNQEEQVRLHQLRMAVSGSSLSGAGSGGRSAEQDAAFVRVIAQIDALETEIVKEMSRYVDLLQAIRESINALNDRDERLILRDRYILGMKWERIAQKRHISIRTARRLHDAALGEIRIPERIL